MKLFVGDEEKEFFKQNGLLAVEDLFSVEEIDSLKADVKKKVSLGVTKDIALTGGRSRELLFSKKLAQVAFELVGRIPLRYGYDLFFGGVSAPNGISRSITPVHIGVCLPLESHEGSQQSTVVPHTLRNEDLALKKGSVLFFLPEVTFSLSPSNVSCIFLFYVGARAQYTFEPEDPFTHDLKKLGYVFGDRVTSETHPMLY